MSPDQQAVLEEVVTHMGTTVKRLEALSQNPDVFLENRRIEIGQHLESCAKCRQLVTDLAEQVELLRTLIPPKQIAAVPSDFYPRLAQRINVESKRRADSSRTFAQAVPLFLFPFVCASILLTLLYTLPEKAAQQLMESVNLFRFHLY